MSKFNRHDVTGVLNQGPGDNAIKVEIHPNAHTSLLNVNSDDRLTNSTYAQANYSIGGQILQSNVNKLAMFSYDIRYCISNINRRNDIITFFSSSSGLEHSVTLISGHYTRDNLVSHIVSQLNGVTGSSGLEFSGDKIVDCNYTLSSDGGEFRFLSSSHIDRASPCSGLFITTDTVPSMIITLGAQYTNFIDVIIDNFRDAQIIQNTFTKDNIFPIIDHMFRIPIEQNEDNAFVFQREQLFNLNYVSIRNKELSTLQISLYDQFGELIFSPTQQLGSQSFNIPLIKYEMKFTISA
jgi:hypothetical protein